MISKGLEKPPKLTHINIGGENNWWITKLQLIFDGGIKSPVIDAQNPESESLSLIPIK